MVYDTVFFYTQFSASIDLSTILYPAANGSQTQESTGMRVPFSRLSYVDRDNFRIEECNRASCEGTIHKVIKHILLPLKQYYKTSFKYRA